METILQVHMICSRAIQKGYIITLLTWFRLDLCWKASKFTVDQRDAENCGMWPIWPYIQILHSPAIRSKSILDWIFCTILFFLKHVQVHAEYLWCRGWLIQSHLLALATLITIYCALLDFITMYRHAWCKHYMYTTASVVSFYLHQLFRKQQQNSENETSCISKKKRTLLFTQGISSTHDLINFYFLNILNHQFR